MAKKSNADDTKTVTGTLKNGTKVTVSEELAGKLGAGFTADAPKRTTSSTS